MKDISKNFLSEIAKTILFVLLTIGVAVFMIMNKYDVYHTVVKNPLVSRITGWGLVGAILIVAVVRLLVIAKFSSSEISKKKKVTWGLLNAVPLLIVYIFANWISDNMAFVSQIVLWSALTNSFAYLFAPNYLIEYKQKKG